jgi:hypothetical protein
MFSVFSGGIYPEEAVCGEYVRRLPGGPEDGGEALYCTSPPHYSLASLSLG